MRRLIVTSFVSLDGVSEAPGGEPGYAHTGWVGRLLTPELLAHKLQEQLAADVLLLGRVTYESFHGAWPAREGEMADKINTMTKAVASTTLVSSPWQGTTVVSDVPAAVAALKEEDGGPVLVVGSRTLVASLLRAGLVDQLDLQVLPIVLGSGQRLLPESPDVLPLRLLECRALGSGIVLQSYAVVGS